MRGVVDALSFFFSPRKGSFDCTRKLYLSGFGIVFSGFLCFSYSLVRCRISL